MAARLEEQMNGIDPARRGRFRRRRLAFALAALAGTLLAWLAIRWILAGWCWACG
jgi:hypothetical protein